MDEVDCKDELSLPCSSDSTCTSDSPIAAMFSHIIDHKDAYFRSEQIGAPDLTDAEKRTMLDNLFAKKPSTFLSRYGQFLDQSHRPCFLHVSDDYDVSFYLAQLAPSRRARTTERSKTTANRRYSALRRLVAEGEYFSDEQMRQREPLLYDQMVGQYLTDLEKGRLLPKSDRTGTLTGLFMDFDDTQRTAIRRREEKSFEVHASRREKLLRHARNRMLAIDPDNEEGGSSDEEEELSEDDEEEVMDGAFPPTVSSEEQAQLRAEFISHMHERFLAGKDEDFICYSDIDSDTRNDPLDLLQRDAEDDYFDSEEPNDVKEE